MIFQKRERERGWPFVFTNRYGLVLSLRPLLRTGKYRFTQSMALLPIGTVRSLLPFPRVVKIPKSRFTSVIFKATSSETLTPVAYKTSSIALSLRPAGVLVSGHSSNRSTSSAIRNFGSDCQDFGVSMFALGSRFK